MIKKKNHPTRKFYCCSGVYANTTYKISNKILVCCIPSRDLYDIAEVAEKNIKAKELCSR